MNRLPAIGTEVLVTPKDNWPPFERTAYVNGYRREFVVVIDQEGDAWDVDLDQINPCAEHTSADHQPLEDVRP